MLCEFHRLPGSLSKYQTTVYSLGSKKSSSPVYRLNVIFSKYLQVEIINPSVIGLGVRPLEGQQLC